LAQHSRSADRTIAGYLFIAPWLVGFLCFLVIPILVSLYISFTEYDLIGEPAWIGLSNFKRLFLQDGRYHKAIGTTFLYVVTAVPLRLAFALFIAMLLCQKRRLIGLYRLAYYMPSIVGGSVAIALAWRMFFGANGPASSIAAWFGVKGIVSLIGDPRTALGTIIALYIWQFGSSMLIFLAGLKNIPESFYEAAVVDGAGSLVKFFRITLPLLSPVILFNLVMQTIHGFLMFTQAWIITQGGPMDSTLVYVVYMFLRAFQFYDMGAASAMAWVLLLIVSLSTLLIFGTSRSWVYYESKEGR
jgi:multiple sugar transport system permease protein